MSLVKINNSYLAKKIDSLDLDKIAKESKFYKRTPKKINAAALLLSFFTMSLNEHYSFRNWAVQLSLWCSVNISKQGIWKRCNETQITFLKNVLERVMTLDAIDFVQKINFTTGHLFGSFNKVLIQDSTCLSLPDRFSQAFKGHTCSGKRRALAKIQSVFDLKTNKFTLFEIGDFSKNDQKASLDIIPLVGMNDLVIRDLGYFVSKVFEDIVQKGAYFISRLRLDVDVFNQEEEKLDILKKLKSQQYLDLKVLISSNKIPVRLVAIKLPAAIAEERKRKALNNRDKRLNPSKQYLKMLEYNFFITNIEGHSITSHQIAVIYGLRWRIETFFKCWKSNFHLGNQVKETKWSEEALRCFLFCMLIFIALTHTHLYHYYWWKFYEEKKLHLSLLKFTEFLHNNLLVIFLIDRKNSEELDNLIAYTCSYETRSDRKNFSQQLIKCS
jgi:hypothetical protein